MANNSFQVMCEILEKMQNVDKELNIMTEHSIFIKNHDELNKIERQIDTIQSMMVEFYNINFIKDFNIIITLEIELTKLSAKMYYQMSAKLQKQLRKTFQFPK